MANTENNGRDRVAVVAGLRTPFTKAGTALKSMRTVDLATAVVKELMQRSELSPKEVRLCVYGQVVPTLDWLNIAREVVLRAGLPRDIDAYSVSRACATSIQALTSRDRGHPGRAARRRHRRRRRQHERRAPRRLAPSSRRAGGGAEGEVASPPSSRPFTKLSPKDLVPPVPGFSREPTTGEQMGEAAEKMAKLQRHLARGAGRHRPRLAQQGGARLAGRDLRGRGDARDPAAVRRAGAHEDNLVRDDSTVEALRQAVAGLRSQARHASPRATPRRSRTGPARSW